MHLPNEAAVTRLAGAVLLELHDEWHVAERRDFAQGSMALLDRLDDDGGEGGGRSESTPASVLDDGVLRVAKPHDGAVIPHCSTGHGRSSACD